MLDGLLYVMTSFWLGAVHAATPGHGKTIAASYIVGVRGRPIDAVVLGVFVTLSHTSGIILVAVLASLGSTWLLPQRIEAYLAVGTGALVIAIGVWMLRGQLRLLSTANDAPSGEHVREIRVRRTHRSHEHPHAGEDHSHANEDHARSHEHHAHRHDDTADLHEDADPAENQSHRHEEHGHSHEHAHPHEHVRAHADDRHAAPHSHAHPTAPPPNFHRHGWGRTHTHDIETLAANRPSLAMLLGLGIAGGLLPDPGALAILLSAIASGRLMLGLLTVVVFSLGFALVLVLVGLVAAGVGRLVLDWLSRRWVRWVQVGAALVIVVVGLMLTANAWRVLGSLR
jgi:nickel/cobalt transporter (NicO) family protein